jgi:hypothetical protein
MSNSVSDAGTTILVFGTAGDPASVLLRPAPLEVARAAFPIRANIGTSE